MAGELCPGCQCELPCGPGICECPPGADDCPRCRFRAEVLHRSRQRTGRLVRRPGRPSQLVLVRDDQEAHVDA